MPAVAYADLTADGPRCSSCAANFDGAVVASIGAGAHRSNHNMELHAGGAARAFDLRRAGRQSGQAMRWCSGLKSFVRRRNENEKPGNIATT